MQQPDKFINCAIQARRYSREHANRSRARVMSARALFRPLPFLERAVPSAPRIRLGSLPEREHVRVRLKLAR